MPGDEWELGDYIVGEIESVADTGVGHFGDDEEIRILGDVRPEQQVLVQITDTAAVGVVAEPVSGIDSDSATVWVQRTTDVNPREPDSDQPRNTFDAMAGGELPDDLSVDSTSTDASDNLAPSEQLGFGVGAITAGGVLIAIIGYGITVLLPLEGWLDYFAISIGGTVAAPILFLSLILIAAGLVLNYSSFSS